MRFLGLHLTQTLGVLATAGLTMGCAPDPIIEPIIEPIGARDQTGDAVYDAASAQAAGCILPLTVTAQTPDVPGWINIYEPTAEDGLNEVELGIYDNLMAHRAFMGLPEIPLSSSLTLVAGRHALDTSRNILARGPMPEGANLHSWSDVLYPDDDSNPQVMWEAPRRLGTNYCANSFEISGVGFSGRFLDPKLILDEWIGSEGHRSVIENTGVWARKTWRAIGVGYVPEQGNAPAVFHVWFSDAVDAAGPPELPMVTRP